MQFRSYWLGCCLLLGGILSAQAPDTLVQLWPEGDYCGADDRDPQIRIDSAIGMLKLGRQDPELHIYRPLARNNNGAAIMICPGGGYYLTAWDWEGVDFARFFVHQGFTVGVLNYRLPHFEDEDCRSDAPLADARRGLQLLRSMAVEEGFSPDRIGIMGFSAGGHLAASASVHFLEGNARAADSVAHYSSRPDLSILVYPVISMDTTKAIHRGSRNNLIGSTPDAEQTAYFSLETQVDSTTPPALLVHAHDDAGVVPDNSIWYYQALRKSGVEAALRIYTGGGHGFGSGVGLEYETAKWLRDVMDYLRYRWPSEETD